MVGVSVGTQAFWKSTRLNAHYCTEMVDAWIEGKRIGEAFFREEEAVPGDVVVYGNRWEDCTFGIHLAPGRIATTIMNPNCWGKVVPRLLLVRVAAVKMVGREFNGGVHVHG